jgi:hypothetical protein
MICIVVVKLLASSSSAAAINGWGGWVVIGDHE